MIGRWLTVKHALDSAHHLLLIFSLHGPFSLIVRLSPLPVLLSRLSSCSTSNMPFGYPFCWVAFIILSFDLLTSAAMKFSLQAPGSPDIPPCRNHYVALKLSTDKYVSSSRQSIPESMSNPLLSLSSLSVLEAQASYEMLAEMIDVFKESKEGKQGKWHHYFSSVHPVAGTMLGAKKS